MASWSCSSAAFADLCITDKLSAQQITDLREEGKEEGREEGRLEISRRWLVRMVEARFSELKPLAQRQVERITNSAILEDLMFQISSAKSSNKARQALLHWEENYK